MTDYKELIERLRMYSQNVIAYKLDADFASAVMEAADAIEAMTAERDALAKRVAELEQEMARVKEET